MRIIIITKSFYPVVSPRSFRATELAKCLSKKNHDVTVLTLKEGSYNYSEYEHIYNLNFIFYNSMLNDYFYNLFNFSTLLSRVWKRLLEQFMNQPEYQFRKLVREKLKKHSKNYDLLISIAAPHSIHWGVSDALGYNSSITNKWIADCGDPFIGATNMQYTPPFYFRFLENSFLRKADFVTVPFKGACYAYNERFRYKIKVIPQGFNFEEVEDIDEDYSLYKDGVLNFGYAGSINARRRDPRILLDYLLEQNIEFRFICFCNNVAILKSYMENHPDKIIVKGIVDRFDLLGKFKTLDFVLNFENEGSSQLPSKIIDYAILRKPILNINVKSLDTNLIDNFFKEDFSKAYEVKNVDDYRIENVADKFMQLSEA